MTPPVEVISLPTGVDTIFVKFCCLFCDEKLGPTCTTAVIISPIPKIVVGWFNDGFRGDDDDVEESREVKEIEWGEGSDGVVSLDAATLNFKLINYLFY